MSMRATRNLAISWLLLTVVAVSVALSAGRIQRRGFSANTSSQSISPPNEVRALWVVHNTHPEWLAVPRAVAKELYSMSPRDALYRQRIVEWSKANRGELEGVYAGPANPKVREHIYRIWMDIIQKYSVDGMHFDYVRFASPDFDYSRTSLKAFRKWIEPQLSKSERSMLEKALKEDPLAATDKYTAKFGDFQREQVTQIVAHIYHAVNRPRPEIIVSYVFFAT